MNRKEAQDKIKQEEEQAKKSVDPIYAQDDKAFMKRLNKALKNEA